MHAPKAMWSLAVYVAMRATDPSGDDASASGEREHLREVHHEICTALTVLRCNVALVRVELRDEADPRIASALGDHLSELDAAVDRLHLFARTLRVRHDQRPQALTPDPREGEPTSLSTSIE